MQGLLFQILYRFGKQHRPMSHARLYQILNYRYAAKMATVVTATDSEIESLDARLYSRIFDPKISAVFPIGAPDYRGGTAKPKSSTRKKR